MRCSMHKPRGTQVVNPGPAQSALVATTRGMTAQPLQATSPEGTGAPTPLVQFLSTFHLDSKQLRALTQKFEVTFRKLAAESHNQFLPTPILTSLLRPIGDLTKGEGCLNRRLAIDIPLLSGGTNLRVGFVGLRQETAESEDDDDSASSTIEVLLERSCPIGEQLKHKNHAALFDWIGQTIAAVVKDACSQWQLDPQVVLPMGVTFSFPMYQHSLSEAVPMSMGKGFHFDEGTDLGSQLLQGYENHRTPDLPPIRVVAIANDSVATLISFIYQYGVAENRSPAMGLIVGTGCNATVTLPLEILGDKVDTISLGPAAGPKNEQCRVAVNTEWTINGTAGPLREMGLITKWDEELDQAGETPGFQPLEYLTSGRYFGPPNARFLEKLENTFPSVAGPSPHRWTQTHVDALYQIAQAIQRRAASLLASATIALLRLAGEIPAAPDTRYTAPAPQGVKMLGPCHGGGITGAGILAAAVLASEEDIDAS
ncbi:unnamed protein product [Parascedosporium putredinis]|uniref:Phosphotransferase n=1 Tax=Parascedosporium putredinis TaxID=1442378 RepID=A0A9P1GV36_9PEZI|nr:unnamed protein product [Parascedosporium putredinis]CAI7987932.1 unnamed protein product [Parascedosporium putredinis]